MTLSDWLIVLSLGFSAYGLMRWSWTHYGPPSRPQRVAEGPQSVKPKRSAPAFKARSRRSNVQNAPNAGSGHTEAVQPVVNVQPSAAAPTQIAPPLAPAAPGDDHLTLTPRELAQLAEALHERAGGATVEEALKRAFGVSKGASAGYVRAKALWDAATVPPGAAPAGTYQPAPEPRKRRRVAAGQR